MRAERRALVLLAAAAVLLAAVMGVTGSFELVLYGGPLLFITGLLLSGRRWRQGLARYPTAALRFVRLP